MKIVFERVQEESFELMMMMNIELTQLNVALLFDTQ